MMTMTRIIYHNKIKLAYILGTLFSCKSATGMETIPAPEQSIPVARSTILLSTAKQQLAVDSKILMPCTTLLPLIASGKQSIPLPAIPEYELVHVAACLQGHNDLLYAPDKEHRERALKKLNAQTNSRQKLYTALTAANYLGHEELITWCQNKWARQGLPVEDAQPLPDELQVPIACGVLEKTNLSTDIPRWLASSKWLNPKQTIKNGLGSIWSVAVDSSSTQVATGDWAGFVHIYANNSQRPVIEINAHNAPISTIAFIQNDTGVITCAQDGTIKYWDLATRTLSSQIQIEHPHAPFVFRMNEPTQHFAYNEDATIVLLNLIDGHERTLRGHTNSLRDIAFNPQGTFLASGGYDNTIVLWDVATAEHIVSLTPHTKTILCVQFSPDGTLLAAGSDDRTISIHNVATQQLATTLRGHTDGIWSVIFSSDNQFLYSGSIDGTVKIWHVPSGLCIKNLASPQGSIQSMSMQPNGTLVTVSKRGHINFWDINKIIAPILALKKELAHNTTINQALLIEDAYAAPQSEPLDCSAKRERSELFATLNPQVQTLLVKHLHVKPPKKKSKPETPSRGGSRSPAKSTAGKPQHHKDLRYNRK